MASNRSIKEHSVNDWPERLFVGAILAAMGLVGIAFIWQYGSTIPWKDDWAEIEYLAGGAGLSFDWLFKSFGGHRYPLSRFVMRMIWDGAGGDLRIAMLLSFLSLVMAACFLIWIARQIRGRSAYTDAIFPLALLHLGHSQNFLWFLQMHSAWATALLIVIGAAFFDLHWTRRIRGVVIGGGALLILALQAATGAIYALVLAIGFLVMGVIQWKEPDSKARRAGMLLISFALGASTVGLLVLWGDGSSSDAGPLSLGSSVQTSIEFLTMSVGSLGRRFWPVSGLAVVGLLAGTVAVLANVAYVKTRRLEIGPLLVLLVLVASGAVALAIGLARSYQGGLLDRYAMYSVPVVVVCYLTWVKYSSSRLSHLVQMCLFTLFCATSLYYLSEGIRGGKSRLDQTRDFFHDVERGIPLSGLVASHAAYWGINEHRFRHGLELIRKNGPARFRDIAPDPLMEIQELPLDNILPYEMAQEEEGWKSKGRASHLAFRLDAPTFVYSIQFDYKVENERNSTQLKLSYILPHTSWDLKSIGSQVIHVNFNSANERHRETQSFWVSDRINEIYISPCEDPCRFQLYSLRLLTSSLASSDSGRISIERPEVNQTAMHQ